MSPRSRAARRSSGTGTRSAAGVGRTVSAGTMPAGRREESEGAAAAVGRLLAVARRTTTPHRRRGTSRIDLYMKCGNLGAEQSSRVPASQARTATLDEHPPPERRSRFRSRRSTLLLIRNPTHDVGVTEIAIFPEWRRTPLSKLSQPSSPVGFCIRPCFDAQPHTVKDRFLRTSCPERTIPARKRRPELTGICSRHASLRASTENSKQPLSSWLSRQKGPHRGPRPTSRPPPLLRPSAQHPHFRMALR